MEQQLSVKPYPFDRDEEVVALLHRVFKPWNGDDNYFRWKYHQLRTDGTDFPRGWIIENNGKIVAFNGYIPRKIKVGGAQIVALQSFDTATDPECRGQGLFGKLQSLIYAEIQKTDIPWIYGWTSEIGFKVFTQKVGWTIWGQQRFLLRLLDPVWFLELKLKNRLLAEIGGRAIKLLYLAKQKGRQWPGEIREENSFPAEVDELCRNWESRFDIVAIRDKNYLDWRNSNPLTRQRLLCAYNDGKMVGYLVHSTEKADELDILDCVWTEASALLALLGGTDDYGLQNSYRIIRFRVTEDDRNGKVFKDAGYFKSRTSFPMVGHCLASDEKLKKLLWKEDKRIYWSLFDRNE